MFGHMKTKVTKIIISLQIILRQFIFLLFSIFFFSCSILSFFPYFINKMFLLLQQNILPKSEIITCYNLIFVRDG